MSETVETTVEVHTPKLLKKLIPNRKAAAGATIVVAAVAVTGAVMFLKSRFDVDVDVTDAVSA